MNKLPSQKRKALRSAFLNKLHALWVFLVFFLLPIFLFSGLRASPAVDQKVAEHKKKVVEHRKDWGRYINPKRVAEQGVQELEQFSEEVLEPIALGLEQSYVEAFSPEDSLKKPQIQQEESDF